MNSRTLAPGTDAFDTPASRDVPPRPSPYLMAVNWAFALFNATRTLTYLPAMWAIYMSADSSQHSLITWFSWVGANASMAAWLYENNGRRMNKAIVVSLCNAVMCLGTCALIGWYRL